MPRIAIFNSKGGVGKTTTALNLGAAAQRAGRAVLTVDLDPQGHLTRIAGEPPRDVADSLFAFFQDARPLHALARPWPGVGALVPAHGQLIKVDSVFGKGPAILNRLRGGLDSRAQQPDQPADEIVLMDCCPNMGVLALNAIFAADALVVPISTDYLSLQAALRIGAALQALEPVLKRRLPRVYLLTRFDRRRRMSYDVQEQLRQVVGEELCVTIIIENVAVAESPAQHKDIFAHSPASTGAQNYQALYEELVRRRLA